MQYYYSPDARYLLINHLDRDAEVLYNNNLQPFRAPIIGLRPPYYANPRYEPYYPVI